MAHPHINSDLYKLILSQLVHDGFGSVAQALSQVAVVPIPTDGGNTLYTLLESTLVKDKEKDSITDMLRSATRDDEFGIFDGEPKQSRPFDLIMDTMGPEPVFRTSSNPNYTTKFITTHKSEVRIAKFSPDGKWVATGSQDTSIKLLDVLKMKSYNETKQETTEDFAPSRPVIRTFYDHNEPINDIDFHPLHPILISASKDHTIRFYEFKSSQKRAFKCIQDTHSVRTIHTHPCGDFLLAGTEHHMIRLYDINTLQAYVARKGSDHHFGPINMVKYSDEGNLFASCSKDGNVKIWDAVSNSVVNTIPNAHSGAEVTSVQFSKNTKYLLTCGKDSCSKLWEISSGKQVFRYAGTPMPPIGFQKHRLMSTFNYNEDFILAPDELQMCVMVWDSRTGEIVQKLTGHNNLVKWVAASTTDNSVMTCSNDHRARFWTDDNNK